MALFDRYINEIDAYIRVKCPDIPKDRMMEIMAFIGYKSCILVHDVNEERDEMWKRSFNRECIPRRS